MPKLIAKPKENEVSTPRYPDSIKVEVVTVTPELAQDWLDHHNTKNRPIRKRHANTLAKAIENGEWSQTPDLIAFDAYGNIINGQHRLHGVVLSGKTIRALVGWGFRDEAYLNTDAGKSRNLADHFGQQDILNAKDVSSVVKTVLRWETTESWSSIASGSSAGKTDTTTTECLDRYRLDPDGFQAATRDGNRIGTRLGQARLMGAYAYRMVEISPDDAYPYVEALVRGVSPDGSAQQQAIFLRETLLADKQRSKKLTEKTKLAYMIKAWNAYMDGVELKQLRWRAGGARPEAFPIMKGSIVDLEQGEDEEAA